MKYVITKDQRFFFEKNHYIEFEGLIKPKDLEVLQKKAARGEIKRDLSRHDKEVEKILHSLSFAWIAAELSSSSYLRFGFDLLLASEDPLFSCLSEESSIQGLKCCMMLCLEGTRSDAKAVDGEGIDPFPSEPGSAVFFLPSTPCNPKSSLLHKEQKFLLFTWAQEQALYVFEPKDPWTHVLKKEGYVFGEQLKEKTHPVILRR
jgi:hypothetical protein